MRRKRDDDGKLFVLRSEKIYEAIFGGLMGSCDRFLLLREWGMNHIDRRLSNATRCNRSCR
jgi:hypothetical protein